MASASNLITALRQVQPGDLITAEFFNGLISAMHELDDRITKLQAECRRATPDDGDTGVRPIRIDTALVKLTPTSRTLAFKITGSGLELSDLEEKFLLSGIPFAPKRLVGDDNGLDFQADRAEFDDDPTAIKILLRALETGHMPEVTLTIPAKRGVSATHPVRLA